MRQQFINLSIWGNHGHGFISQCQHRTQPCVHYHFHSLANWGSPLPRRLILPPTVHRQSTRFIPQFAMGHKRNRTLQSSLVCRAWGFELPPPTSQLTVEILTSQQVPFVGLSCSPLCMALNVYSEHSQTRNPSQTQQTPRGLRDSNARVVHGQLLKGHNSLKLLGCGRL